MKKVACILVVLSMLLSNFVGVVLNAQAEGLAVIISEIGAYEKSDHEWVEIYNRGAEVVDLTGWKFYEDKTNHKLTLSRGADLIIDPGEYGIIAQNADNFIADYPAFVGMVVDSSWGSLNENGEEIGLKDTVGVAQELFTYSSANGTSLQRKDLNADDYTAANWQAHATGNSAGRANDFSAPEPEQPPADEPPVIPPVTENNCGGLLKINEFVSDPADGEEEFVELFNTGDAAVDLTGWTLSDGGGRQTVLSGQVESEGFFVIEKPSGVLNNTGDKIILKCGDAVINQVTYGIWDDGNKNDNAPVAEDPNSVARVVDGQDSGADNIDWQATTEVTKGLSNIIVQPPAPVTAGRTTTVSADKDGTEETTVEKEKALANFQGKIVFNELLPNPVGVDTEKEFIELKNISQENIDLVGWQLVKGTKSYKIKADKFLITVVGPGGLFLISRKASGVALKNTGDKILLEDSAENFIDEVEYTDAATEGVGYSLDSEKKWQWSGDATPGEENIISKPNQQPEAMMEITKPRRTETDEEIVFDASDSLDPDGDVLTYNWDLGDGQKLTGESLGYSYQKAGKFKVILTITDGRGGQDAVKKTINIYAPVEEDILAPEAVSSSKIKAAAVKTKSSGLIAIKGLVAVEPGVLGSQIMYLQNTDQQIYFNKKDWPELKLGQEVEVVGELTVSGGEPRLKISSQSNLKIINPEPAEVLPEPVEIISEESVGSLIIVRGEVTELKASNFYLDNGQGEIAVYLKSTAGIKKPDLAIGQQAEVTGIVTLSGGELKVLPRYQSDIKLLPGETKVLGAEMVKKNYTGWYLLGAAAVVGGALVGLMRKFKVKAKK